MHNSLLTLAQHFNVLRLRFTLQLKSNWQLPVFKGSLFHGWLGQAAKQYDEQLFHVLFSEHDSGQPKPYALKLSDDHKIEWQQGELISFDVMLFGEAVSLANKLLSAVAETNLGIGELNNGRRCQVALVSAASVVPGQLLPGIVPTQLIDWFDAPAQPNHCEFALQLKSPLRLKSGGKVTDTFIPDLYCLNTQACRRLTLLSQYWVTDDANLLGGLRQQLPRLGQHEVNHHTYFENWQRFSLNMKKYISFGGLKGQLSFYGDIAPGKHWLQTAQVLGLGGKTTFGLGHFELIG